MVTIILKLLVVHHKFQNVNVLYTISLLEHIIRGCNEFCIIVFRFLTAVMNSSFFKPVFLDQGRFKAEHERGIILHAAAAKALQAARIGRLPNVAALQSEYEKLKEQKEALYAYYGKLKKLVKEYDIIKQNIDCSVKVKRRPEQEREKGADNYFAGLTYFIRVHIIIVSGRQLPKKFPASGHADNKSTV